MVALVVGGSEIFWSDHHASPFLIYASFVRSLIVRVGFDDCFKYNFEVAITLDPNFYGIELAQVVLVFCNTGTDNNVASQLVGLVLHVEHVFTEDGTVGFFDALCRILVQVVLDGCAVVRLDVPIVLVL